MGYGSESKQVDMFFPFCIHLRLSAAKIGSEKEEHLESSDT